MSTLSLAFPEPLADKYRQHFISHVEVQESGCWLWAGSINASGYATFKGADCKTWLAHRWAYRHIRGIEPGPELHHQVCKIRRCVNPWHCESVKPDLHPDKPSVLNRSKQTCPKGHPYSGNNLYTDPTGHRHCRACKAQTDSRSYFKRWAKVRAQQAEYHKRRKP